MIDINIMYNPRQQRLLVNFAEKVLDLETELDEHLSLSLIRELTELYSVKLTQRAIEYYSSISNNKYLHYQKRLQQLLANTQIQSLLDNNLVQKPRFFSPPHSHIKRTAQKVVDHHYLQSHNVMARVRQNLRSQDSVESRLEARRRSQSVKRNASPNGFIIVEPPSGLIDKDQNVFKSKQNIHSSSAVDKVQTGRKALI